METRIFIMCAVATAMCCSQACKEGEKATIVTPNAVQLEWANAEVGVMFHYDMQVYQTDYQWRKWGTHPPAEIFNPS
ncbi:MAG: hypothetical protein LBR06_04960, partial [Bacteroidales bacterium]|nr:hypothetical protein [Bacteroidales bacterium]